ncbi:MAG: hypothetical protein A2152_02940 [Candidatus Levybacteria bacterium RBG_16_35_6]|nr:MAG: hypothetical protein A2152_02940 [Candidatus Levybacteria bacterium RBG_16_35_6]
MISGYVFIDTDRDGVKDVGEVGYAGGANVITSNGLVAYGTITRNTPAGWEGYWSFPVESGTWIVSLTVPVGYTSYDGLYTAGTSMQKPPLNVTMDLSNLNFGIIALPTPTPTITPTPTPVTYTVKGYVFYDHNENKIFDRNATIPEECLDVPVTINACGIQQPSFNPTDSNWTTDPSSGCKLYSYTCSGGNSCQNVIIQNLPGGYFVTGWSGSDATRPNISGMSGASAYVCGVQ